MENRALRNESDGSVRDITYFELLSGHVRSSLTGLMGSLSMVDTSSLDEVAQGQITGSRAAATRLNDLISAISDLEALRTNSVDLSGKPLELASLFKTIDRRWSAAASSRGFEFAIELREGTPGSISADKTWVKRILNTSLGLIADLGGITTLRVRVQELTGGDLEFAVCGEGAAFEEHLLATLFDLPAPPDGEEGAVQPISAYVARTVVERMSGTLFAENSPDGARIVMCLPAAIPEVRAAETSPEPAPEPVTAAPSQKKAEASKRTDLPDLSHLNILMAEDNLTNQLVTTQMLKAMGAKYCVAGDGVEALEEFEKDRYDLALLDIEMPRMSGLEVIRNVRAKNDHHRDIPLIALTAYALQEHRERILGAGANGIIPKPLTGIEDLGNAILAHLAACSNNSGEALGPSHPVPTIEPSLPSGKATINRATYDGLSQSIGADSMTELLRKVSDDIRSVKTGIETGLTGQDASTIRSNTHILISVAGAIGAESLQHTAQKLNASANRKDWDEIRTLSPDCLSGIDGVVSFIQQEMAS